MGIGGFEPPTLGALTAQTTNKGLIAAIRPMLFQAKLYAPMCLKCVIITLILNLIRQLQTINIKLFGI